MFATNVVVVRQDTLLAVTFENKSRQTEVTMTERL